MNKFNILVIGAHPDDCEIRVGGTTIKFLAQGHRVKYISATNGDAGHFSMERTQIAQVRKNEVKKVQELYNIEYEVLDISDNNLEPSLQYRNKMINLIRMFKPDLLITHRLYDYHPDHRYTSLLVQDSSFALSVPLVCSETEAMKELPIILHMYDDFLKPVAFRPDVIVDIDDVFDEKVKMMDCHKSQVYEWLPWVEKVHDMIPKGKEDRIKYLHEWLMKRDAKPVKRFKDGLIKKYGNEKGSKIKLAEAFELSEYGRQATADELSRIFNF
jgi:LmbE family N-acetylglucosaminyl deacetylase